MSNKSGQMFPLTCSCAMCSLMCKLMMIIRLITTWASATTSLLRRDDVITAGWSVQDVMWLPGLVNHLFRVYTPLTQCGALPASFCPTALYTHTEIGLPEYRSLLRSCSYGWNQSIYRGKSRRTFLFKCMLGKCAYFRFISIFVTYSSS